jgi:hypothetical protein
MCFVKRILVILSILLFAHVQIAHAQTFGNEWIDYQKQYWKFPVVADGLYRLNYTDLLNGGFPVSGSNPQNIRIFGRGAEIPIVINGEADGSFDPGDNIEFIARRNDAWLDSLVYDDPSHLANPGYSLFNDTAWYFITAGTTPGLRMGFSNANNFEDFSPLPFCTFRSELEFHTEYLVGSQDANGISLPIYETAEGWFDTRFPKGGSHEKFVPTPFSYNAPGTPDAKVRCISASASMAVGFPNHHLQVGWGDPLNITYDTTYYGYQLNNLTFSIAAQQLANSTRIVHRSVDDLGVAADFHAVSYISIDYPRTFDFSTSNYTRFSIAPDNSLSHARLTMNTQAGSRLFARYNTQITEIELTWNGAQYEALVPTNSSSAIELILVSVLNSLTSISPVTTSGYFTPYYQSNLSNGFLIVTHPMLIPAAQNYGAWRNTNESSSLVANVEELYMQYAYGIEKHPLAIRRFCDHLLNVWNEPPQHLFLIGKSIHDAGVNGVTGSRNNPDKYSRNLVPTWGYPGSDAVFTSGLAGTVHQQAIPTGRLAANNGSQVLEYLNKVIEHETQPPDLWQKNVMHFGGGSIQFEQNMFRNFLNGYKAIAQDTSMGAQVYSFFKNTTDPIQMNVSDSIHLLINEGVSVMTFFGHASSTGFDQNIDSPQSYNNQGKYPLLIGNSCYTGNIHLGTNESASEMFVLVPNRGMIGFLAKSDLGLPGFLDLYTNQFYRQICQENYGKSIGYCMKKAVENFQVENNLYRANVAYNFALHGDPSVKIHPHAKPDYRVSIQDIIFAPNDITASMSNFEVQVIVENIGKAVANDVGIELVRHYPDGTDSTYIQTVDQILNQETVVFQIPNNTDIAAGENTFDVFVDYPLNLVDEIENTANNIVTGKSLLITSGDLFPVVPYEFAVINQLQPTLRGSTGFAFEPERTYLLQADTTDRFDSPMLHTTSITQPGGVVEWQLPFAMTDSMVIFWRCTADSTSPENGYKWRGSSFQYIQGEKGWGQDHFFQFRNNQLTNLGYDEQTRQWGFAPTLANMKCEVYGGANSLYEGLATRYQLNLNVQEYGGYGYGLPALMVAVLDSATFIPWECNYNGENPGFNFGNTLISANARARAERYFIFQQHDASQLTGFVNMMEEIPDHNYVLVYTWQYAVKDNWDNLAPQVLDVFENLGATDIASSADSLPFIFFMKKGHPETMVEVVGEFSDSYIALEVPLEGSLGSGNMRSPIIGPASEWETGKWEFSTLENTPGDTVTLQIHGIGWQGNEVLLHQTTLPVGEFENISSIISAESYPYMRFEADMQDFESYTSPQNQRWHVRYTPVPECAIDPATAYVSGADTVSQGEAWSVAVAIRNISAVGMDSLKVQYMIEDQNRQQHILSYPLQAPLGAGEILYDTLQISTESFPGANTLFIEVNPLDSATNRPHQPEQFHFNNLAKLHFFAQPDLINPILDVTFDGVHIMNGDIVSSQPEIAIVLDDESQFFILDEESDTSSFKIYLRRPDKDFESVYYSSGELEWIPASAPANKCRINFTPLLAKDGSYTLKVQASDKSGNTSGSNDYRIDFEVFNQPSITEVLNYPNPFSTRTQFVFTLTGSVPPDEMKIQIMTVGGDIVREITQDELGPMRIGRNLTGYWWDGTDEFGDQLANGVYLYRVVAKIDGQEIGFTETTASRFFKKGFGKMYLMR